MSFGFHFLYVLAFALYLLAALSSRGGTAAEAA
jgi:hypothetical protein